LGINIPIAAIAVALAIPFIHESKAAGNRTYDIPGAITATLGLVSLVYGFSQAATKGWGNRGTWEFFVLAGILLVAFFLIQGIVKNPLLPLRVLTERNRGGSYLATLLVGTGLFAMFLFLSIYMQLILHYSALRSGFAFLPFSGGIILTAGVAAQLLPKVGPRPLMTIGLLVASVGLFFLSHITPTSSYFGHLFPAMVVISVGMAFFFIPSASTGLHHAGEHDAGVASAMINTSQQIGGSLGAALLNTVAINSATAFAKGNASLGAKVGVYAQVHGFDTAFRYGAGFLALASLVSFVMINVGKDSLVETEGAAAL